jgi:hypothetical protein
MSLVPIPLQIERPNCLPQNLQEARIGGVAVYTWVDTDIHELIGRVCETMDSTIAGFLSATRSVIIAAVRDSFSFTGEPRKLLSAILNLRLHFGKADTILCSAISGKSFPVIVSADRTDDFTKAIESTRQLLRARNEVTVADVERMVFGPRAYNTWSSSSHLLARLVKQGMAVQLDQRRFQMPNGFKSCL